jgi:hypothetical protein
MILVFAIIFFCGIAWVIGGTIVAAFREVWEQSRKPKPRPYVHWIPPQQPVMPISPPSETSDWVDYAMRNPAVKVQVVEKVEVSDGQFTAEKHMKMTGPVQQQTYSQRDLICIFPSGPFKPARQPDIWGKMFQPRRAGESFLDKIILR